MRPDDEDHEYDDDYDDNEDVYEDENDEDNVDDRDICNNRSLTCSVKFIDPLLFIIRYTQPYSTVAWKIHNYL